MMSRTSDPKQKYHHHLDTKTKTMEKDRVSSIKCSSNLFQRQGFAEPAIFGV
jgi:hypothetical protein